MALIAETTVVITAQSTYPTNPQLTVPFTGDWFQFANTSATAIAHVSFDGVIDHIYINPALSPFASVPGNPKPTARKMWFRRDTAGADVVSIVVTGGTNL